MTAPVPAVARRRRAAGILAAFTAGVAVATQARTNGALAGRLEDGIAAALVSYAVSMLLLAVAMAVMPSGRRGLAVAWSRLRDGGLRPWELLGGTAGTIVVTAQGLAVTALGVAPFTVAVVAGQTGGGLIVDRVGLAPGGARALTWSRLVAAVLTVVAVALSVSRYAAAPGLIALAAYPLLAGGAIAAQAALNGRVRVATDSLLATTVVNGLVGSVAVLLVAAVWFGVRGLPDGVLPASPWYYAGGALGLGVTATSAAVVRHIGVLLLGLAMIAGQGAGSLALDVVAPGRAGAPTAATYVGAALTVAAVALAARRPRL